MSIVSANIVSLTKEKIVDKKVLLECLSAPTYLIPCALIFDRTLFLFGRDNKIKSFAIIVSSKLKQGSVKSEGPQ